MGGDARDPRDQVGVDPTGPAVADAEPAHPVWGYPFPAAGPPDLDHAIQAATDALDDAPTAAAATGWRWWDAQDVAQVAVEAAAPVLLHATRDRLADLEADVQRLREVVDVARECVPIKVGTTRALERLEEALAALNGPAAQEECGWVHWPTDEDADAEAWCHLPGGHAGEHQPEDGPAAQEEGG